MPIIFFAFIFALFLHPIDSDGDFYHHLNTGKLVVAHKSLPHLDPFTFTAQGHEFIGYAWASGVLFFLLYSNFGPMAINAVVAVVAGLTFILLYAWLKTYRVSSLTTVLALGLAATVVATRWPSRPEIFTYPFLISVLLIDRLKSRRPHLPLLYPLLFFLWGIFYGASLFVGLILLIILNFRRPIIHHSSFIILSLGASLLNGYGLNSLLFITLVPRMTRLHGDWANLLTLFSLAPHRVWPYLIYVLVYLLTLIVSWRQLARYRLELLLSLALVIPFLASRHIPLAITLSLPAWALSFNYLKAKLRQLGMALVASTIALGFILSLTTNPPGLGEDMATFPKQLITFIRQHHLSGKIFTTQRRGAWLTYYLYPDILVFADTRDELFLGVPALKQLEAILPSGKSLLPLIHGYGINLILADLAESESYQPLISSPSWSVVYLKDSYALIVPTSVAQKGRLPILNPPL